MQMHIWHSSVICLAALSQAWLLKILAAIKLKTIKLTLNWGKSLPSTFFYQVLAVKKFNSSLVNGSRPEEFSQIVSSICKLHHPNIAELVGYCSEQEHILIYDYYRNGSLHDFLHLSDDFSKPLTWNTRVRIALGTARAVELVYIYNIVTFIFWHSCYDCMEM